MVEEQNVDYDDWPIGQRRLLFATVDKDRAERARQPIALGGMVVFVTELEVQGLRLTTPHDLRDINFDDYGWFSPIWVEDK